MKEVEIASIKDVNKMLRKTVDELKTMGAGAGSGNGAKLS